MNQSSIQTLMSITSDLIRVYPKLRDIITESKSYDDPMKYVNFRSGSVRGVWFAANYLSTRRSRGLKKCLLETNCDAGKFAARLEVNMDKQTSSIKGISGNKNFQRLEDVLPEILTNLSKKEIAHSSSLVSLAKRLTYEMNKTNVMLEELAEFVESEKEEIPKDKNDGLLGQQNVAVEAIISAALATLDGKVAHGIRTLLAKSDNKLLVLQQELGNI